MKKKVGTYDISQFGGSNSYEILDWVAKWVEEVKTDHKTSLSGGLSNKVWNWIQETSFKMESESQKGELLYPTSPGQLQTPSGKEGTLHSQKEAYFTTPARRNNFFYAQPIRKYHNPVN